MGPLPSSRAALLGGRPLGPTVPNNLLVKFPPRSACPSGPIRPCTLDSPGGGGGKCAISGCVPCYWRRTQVPPSFLDLPAYVSVMQTAVVHEMNRALGCIAQRYFKAAGGKVSDALRRHVRAVGVPLYLKCELVQVCGGV